MLFLDDFLNFLGRNPFERTLSVILLAFAAYFAYRWVLEPVYTALRGMWNFWKLRNTKASFLEVTPPKHSEKQPVATQQLFAVLRQLTSDTETMSVEIVSSRKEGIRYLIRALPGDIPTIKRHIVSYLPEAQFRVLESFTLPDVETTDKPNRVFEIKQSGHYSYPLQPHEDLEASDPVSYIAGAMTKLEPDETIIMQMVLARHHSYWTTRIINQIMTKGYTILGIRNKVRYFVVGRWKIWLVAAIIGVLFNNVELALSVALLLLIISFFMPQEEPTITDGEKELYTVILQKLKQPLFRTDIRMLVVANSYGRLADLSNGLVSSLAPLDGEQQLYIPRLYPDWLGQKIGKFKLVRRMPSFLVYDANILATSELASIYHFPYGTIKIEGMARTHSRTLPAPTLIKNRADESNFDVMLGRNNHHGEINDIGLTADERERHMYVIGGTGNGKTTLLQYAIIQDIQNRKGVAVVDPHGDLAARLLKYIPKDRLKDVIYFDPSDISNPIGVNLLELPEGLIGDQLLLAQDFVTEAIVSIFRKTFSEDDKGGHRIEHVLRNAVHTAFAVEGANLFTVRKLLNNADFRKQVVAKLEDEDIRDFWINEFGLAGNYQKYKAMDGVITKIGRFQRSVVTRRILEQEKSTINFDEILDGKILICNLAKGTIGEDTSAVLGTAILTKLQLAAYRRITIKEEDRRPFYLYVDEFQNFVSPLFIQILSESRKYKLFLTMAEQSTSQQDRQLTENILDNAGTIVCFRTGNPADEELMLHQFKGYVEEGEITHLPSFNFYMRIGAGKAQEAFSGTTVVVEDEGDSGIAEAAKDYSRRNYAIPYKPRPKTEVKVPAQTSDDAKKNVTPKRDRLKRGKNNKGSGTIKE